MHMVHTNRVQICVTVDHHLFQENSEMGKGSQLRNYDCHLLHVCIESSTMESFWLCPLKASTKQMLNSNDVHNMEREKKMKRN